MQCHPPRATNIVLLLMYLPYQGMLYSFHLTHCIIHLDSLIFTEGMQVKFLVKLYKNIDPPTIQNCKLYGIGRTHLTILLPTMNMGGGQI
ncbi:hypothetical protein JZ751_017506 [Albula glossodonta]|uniref:Uncharacterized protein n=1 Tax=Albula glossodonta TaxID=121402 RepID=A0A8T2PL11_9TELE|nr:hypothetical protein JZ751_017506 [Albula glossodonta]